MKPLYVDRKQSGAVLIVSLIMLLLLTIIGMASMGGTLLEERMSGNLRDQNLALQAAEAALREGETVATLDSGAGSCAASGGFDGSDGCYSSEGRVCIDADASNDASCWPGSNDPANWADWTSNGRTLSGAKALPKVAEQPRFVVERQQTQETCPENKTKQCDKTSYFKVTARGVGGNVNTVVVLQSLFRRDY
jgi:type IV pilus assembly protein PilX